MNRVLLLLVLAALAASARAAERPHIVYLLADDLGWHDLGFLSKEIRTPNIDRLAEGALRLNQFYVQPYSTQTRAALLTGRYPMRYGLQTLSLLPESTHGLPGDERTLAQALKQAGYRTALVGKWQLGHASAAMRPTQRGFDYHYGPLMGQVDPFTLAGTAGPDWWRNDKRVKDKGYATTLLGNDAARLIAQHDPATPLFLLVSFTAPAAPLGAPKELIARNAHIRDETRRVYAGMVSALDDAVGAVLAALDKRGMAGNTLVVFHSDNGGAVPHKHPSGDGDVSRGAADNGPYRDGKGSLYEGGVRVPALVRWPGRIETGVANALMHVTDMYPTLLALAGGSGEQRKPLDGVDQGAALQGGGAGTRKEVLLAVEEFRGAIRAGDWKLIAYSAMPARVELYDVPHDPGEEDNAADRNPELVKQLRAKLDEYAWEMVPSQHLDALGRPHKTPVPMVWGSNPVVHGVGSDADSRRDPSLTVERADRQ
jgi:arylsulfatase A-like enzyme